MCNVRTIEADGYSGDRKNNIGLVHATLNWITALGFQVDSVVEPFKDQLDTTKVSCS
jgi:hypothetical protein